MTDAAVPTGRRKRDRKPTLDFADPAGQPLMTGAESVVSFETLMNELESAPPLESTRSPVRAHAPRPYYAYGMVCSPIGRADRSGERRESAPSRHLRKLGAHLSGPPARVQSLPRSSSFLDRRSRLLVRIVSTLLIFAALCGVALALAVSVRILALDHREHNVDVKRSAQVGPGGAPRSTVARLAAQVEQEAAARTAVERRAAAAEMERDSLRSRAADGARNAEAAKAAEQAREREKAEAAMALQALQAENARLEEQAKQAMYRAALAVRSRTERTRRVPRPVLTRQASSLVPY